MMTEYFLKDRRTLLRFREGPIGPCMDRFSEQLRHDGFSAGYACLLLRQVAGFSQWLKSNRIELHEVVSEHAQKYLRYRVRKHRHLQGAAAAVNRILNFLHQEGLSANEPEPTPTPAEAVTREFVLYLQTECALAPATVKYYREFAGKFLSALFADAEVDVSKICATDVVSFVRQQASIHTKRSRQVTTALRSFLRYARYRGYVEIDLAACVPAVATWSGQSLPKSLPQEDVQLVLASCDRGSAIGRRDYAMFLLLARLGLRAGEVVSLSLDDMDWLAGLIGVHGKGGQWCQLPLPTDVGEAIAAYLLAGRAPSACRALFLRQRPPFRSLSVAAVSTRVRYAIERAGVNALRTGAHQFRHSLATEMLRQGFSLAEIGEILRHRSPQSTEVYAKVDLNSLRPLALRWPGGAQ